MPVVQPSNAFVDLMRFGATLVIAQLTVYSKGVPTIYTVPVSTLSITVDRNSAHRRSGNITAEILPTVPPPAILPTGPSSALAPFGNEVFIQIGLAAPSGALYAAASIGAIKVQVYNPETIAAGCTVSFPDGTQYTVTGISGSSTPYTVTLASPLTSAEAVNTTVHVSPQWVPMGLFAITTTTVDDTSLDLTTNLEVYDRSWVISQRQFIQAYTFPATSTGNFVAEIMALIDFVWYTNQATGEPIPDQPTLSFNIAPTGETVPAATYDQGSDPWQAALDMAEACGYELFFDVNGVVTGFQVPNPFTQPITWNFTDDPTNVYGTAGSGSGGGSATLLGSVYSTPVEVQNKMTRDGIYNDVYITGVGTSNAPYSSTGNDAPVLGESADISPAAVSPTSIYGPIGDIPEFASSNLVNSGGQAQAMANALLLQALSSAWEITLTIPPNPIFDVDDVVTVTRPRVGLTNVTMVIDTLQYTVSYSDVCQVTGRVLQPLQTGGNILWLALMDSGPNGQNLQLNGIMNTVPSPGGSAFNQAVQSAFQGSYMQGPFGTGNDQGAATGSAFTAEAIIQWALIEPSTAAGGNALTRVGGPTGNQWVIGLASATPNIEYSWVDSSGTKHSFTGTTTIASGSAYAVALTWDGSTVRGFCNGALDGSVSVSSVAAPTAGGALRFPGSSGLPGIIVDEVRISDTCRYTSAYTPATAPFTSDGSTGCLYHLDSGFYTTAL